MQPLAVDCRNIVKTFQRHTIPINMLQDRLLKWHLRGRLMNIEALRDVSLSIKRGEWVGLYGANGSGKTTLLKIIAGLLRQESGEVFLDGRLSCFFELGVGFHLERRADENIYIHGLLQGMRKSEILRMTDRIIDFAGVRSHAELPLTCFSTGMRMRLAFAAASQIDADIYLFDEVLAVGDEEFKHKCWDYLAALKKAGKTVIIVNHILGNLNIACDRIVFLEKGKIINEKPVER